MGFRCFLVWFVVCCVLVMIPNVASLSSLSIDSVMSIVYDFALLFGVSLGGYYIYDIVKGGSGDSPLDSSD